ncbi:LOW QUALITY PROTEIN: hypothetical protein ACHAXR_004123 [Thalassiosira sp. AJA248-18]
MADIASRPTKAKQLFQQSTDTDSDFLSAFSHAFPLPDNQEWQLATIQDWIVTNIFETLPIGNATVDGAERQRHWKAWESHTKAHGVDLYLQTVSAEERTEALLTFAVAIRSGKYGQKHQIRVQSVDKALRHVAQAFVLARVPDPRRQFSTTKAFDRPIELLLKKYRDTDPPKQPKLAIPVSTIETLKTGYTFSEYHRAIADLVNIAFFFLRALIAVSHCSHF